MPNGKNNTKTTIKKMIVNYPLEQRYLPNAKQVVLARHSQMPKITWTMTLRIQKRRIYIMKVMNENNFRRIKTTI